MRRVPFPRVERHDRFVGGLKPREKVTESGRVRVSPSLGVIALVGIGPSTDRGTFCCPPRRVRRAPVLVVRLVKTVLSVRRLRLLGDSVQHALTLRVCGESVGRLSDPS